MAVNLGINDFISKFDGGSKPNLYKVLITGSAPANKLTNDLTFFCKSTTLPASSIGEIAVPYLGRVIKVPGDRTFDDWTVTIMNNEGMPLRKIFEEWNAVYNGYASNMPGDGITSIYAHVRGCEAAIEQLDRKGHTVRKYSLKN